MTEWWIPTEGAETRRWKPGAWVNLLSIREKSAALQCIRGIRGFFRGDFAAADSNSLSRLGFATTTPHWKKTAKLFAGVRFFVFFFAYFSRHFSVVVTQCAAETERVCQYYGIAEVSVSRCRGLVTVWDNNCNDCVKAIQIMLKLNM